MKYFLLFSLMAMLILVISCAPTQPATDEEAFLQDSESTLAGQAVQIGACPQTRPAISCSAMEDGSYKVIYRQRSRDVTRIIRNSCGVSGRNRAFQVLGCSAAGLEYCNYECETGETCKNGFCVTAQVPACTDTDNGLDTAVRGSATGTLSIAMPGLGNRGDQVTVTDQCLGTNLREWGCDATGYITHRIGPCAAGQTCREGACVSTEGPICDDIRYNDYSGRVVEGVFQLDCEPVACIDNDPTNSPILGGTLTLTARNGEVLAVTWGEGQGHELPLVDSCVLVAGMINETICGSGSGYNLGRSIIVYCPSGTTCTDPDGPTGATPAVCS